MSSRCDDLIGQVARALAVASCMPFAGMMQRHSAATAIPIVAQAVTDRVRDLHRRHVCTGQLRECRIVLGGQCARVDDCAGCGQIYPCATVRLLDRIGTEWVG